MKRIVIALEWFLTTLALAVLLLPYLGVLDRLPSPSPASPPAFDEAMDSLSSHGTSLLFCLESRTRTVCQEFGLASSECQSVRMADNHALFERVRDTNRCLDGAAHGTPCPLLKDSTSREVRAGIALAVKRANTNCTGLEEDSTLQGIIDSAYQRQTDRCLTTPSGPRCVEVLRWLAGIQGKVLETALVQ